MKAIVTVIGKDRVGIIASVCGLLSKSNINILDISQTVLQAYFTMIMLVDISASSLDFTELGALLEKEGKAEGLTIRIQREELFEAMHRI